MMNQLSTGERPRERCLHSGPECLSLRECFAVLLGTGPQQAGCLGVAGQLIGDDGDEQTFFRRIESHGEFSLHGIKGLGPAGRARVLVAMELAKRYARYRMKKQNQVEGGDLPRQVLELVPENMRYATLEQVGMVPMFSDGALGKFQVLQRGSEMGVPLCQKTLMRGLLYSKAEGFWLFHNHTSAQSQVSEADRTCTRDVRTLSRLLGIAFFGHWVFIGARAVKV